MHVLRKRLLGLQSHAGGIFLRRSPQQRETSGLAIALLSPRHTRVCAWAGACLEGKW